MPPLRFKGTIGKAVGEVTGSPWHAMLAKLRLYTTGVLMNIVVDLDVCVFTLDFLETLMFANGRSNKHNKL